MATDSIISNSPVKKYSFKKSERIHRNKEFETIFRDGKKFSNYYLSIYVYKRPNSLLPPVRFGIIISRKLGKATRRNKLKRRLREIFRLNKNLLKSGYDIIVIPKEFSMELDFYSLKEAVFRVWKKAGLIKNTELV